MQINFTGIRNIGYERRYYEQSSANDPNEEFDDEYFEEKEQEHFINIELTDDVFGNDLTEYKNIIKTTDLKNYTNPINPNFLNIMMSKDEVKTNLEKITDYQFWINDSENEFVVNDQNLKMLSFIAKILRRISNTPDEKFVVNQDYLNNDDAKDSVILGEDLKETYGEYYDDAKLQIHDPEHIKNGAKKMNNILQEVMMDYFA